MAFDAKLDMDPWTGKDKQRTIVDFSYTLSRDYSATGRVSGNIRGGVLKISIESTKESVLWDWMVGKSYKEGKVLIMDEKDTEKPAKTIEFKDAYLADYSESYFWQGTENMIETFVLSAREISVNGNPHENEWPDWKS